MVLQYDWFDNCNYTSSCYHINDSGIGYVGLTGDTSIYGIHWNQGFIPFGTKILVIMVIIGHRKADMKIPYNYINDQIRRISLSFYAF